MVECVFVNKTGGVERDCVAFYWDIHVGVGKGVVNVWVEGREVV